MLKPLIFLFIVLISACGSKKTGIEGDNNTDNTVIIAEKGSTITQAEKYLSSVPSNIFSGDVGEFYLELGNSIGYVENKFGKAKEVWVDDNKEKEYEWELENGSLTIRTLNQDEEIIQIDILFDEESNKKIDITGLIKSFSNRRTYNTKTLLGSATFGDILNNEELSNSFYFGIRESVNRDGSSFNVAEIVFKERSEIFVLQTIFGLFDTRTFSKDMKIENLSLIYKNAEEFDFYNKLINNQ